MISRRDQNESRSKVRNAVHRTLKIARVLDAGVAQAKEPVVCAAGSSLIGYVRLSIG